MQHELKEQVTHGTPGYPFAIYRIQNAKHAFVTPVHWHEEMEIIFILSGCLYLTIGEEAYVAKSGDLFIVNSKEIHGMSFDRLDTGYLTILFPLSFLTSLNIDDSSTDYLMPLTEQKIAFIHRLSDSGCYESIKADIYKITQLNREKTHAYRFGTKVCLMDILYQLFSNDLVFKMARKSDDDSLNRSILSYIQSHYTAELSLATAASRFHMSEKYFSRYFKRTFHLTFVEYVNRLRIEHAAELLAHSGLTVTEIAMQCGYSSSSYFNKRFKTLMGMTPTEYRQQ